MSHPRLFLPEERWASRVELQPDERRHLVDVLRLAPGSEVEVFNGTGTFSQANVVRDAERYFLELGPSTQRLMPSQPVRLGVALLKGRKLDEVVRMATELGVSTVEPFTCARSIPRPDGAGRARRTRWQKIAAEASRQSGRASVPHIKPVRTFDELLRESTQDPTIGSRAVLYEAVLDQTLLTWLASATSGERLLLVGPEGGFDPDEVERAKQAGFAVLGLGPTILRSDTAAIAAAALACLDSQQRLGNRLQSKGHNDDLPPLRVS
jgi:16S rRNA (uracil1498-N3)-methyltransferase